MEPKEGRPQRKAKKESQYASEKVSERMKAQEKELEMKRLIQKVRRGNINIKTLKKAMKGLHASKAKGVSEYYVPLRRKGEQTREEILKQKRSRNRPTQTKRKSKAISVKPLNNMKNYNVNITSKNVQSIVPLATIVPLPPNNNNTNESMNELMNQIKKAQIKNELENVEENLERVEKELEQLGGKKRSRHTRRKLHHRKSRRHTRRH